LFSIFIVLILLLYVAPSLLYISVVDYSDELSDFLTDVSSGSRKEKTYFWQYNLQSKGPKGKRLCRVVQDENPYILHDFEDPVFDTELLVSL